MALRERIARMPRRTMNQAIWSCGWSGGVAMIDSVTIQSPWSGANRNRTGHKLVRAPARGRRPYKATAAREQHVELRRDETGQG